MPQTKSIRKIYFANCTTRGSLIEFHGALLLSEKTSLDGLFSLNKVHLIHKSWNFSCVYGNNLIYSNKKPERVSPMLEAVLAEITNPKVKMQELWAEGQTSQSEQQINTSLMKTSVRKSVMFLNIWNPRYYWNIVLYLNVHLKHKVIYFVWERWCLPSL